MTIKKFSRRARLLVWAKNFAKSNPIASATFITGLLGGLTLFSYCLVIGQAPDFTLSDALGTFIAACLTGFVLLCALAFTCIAPGAYARYVLDACLPEKPEFSHYKIVGDGRVESARVAHREMRATMLNGPFALELSALAVLAWSTVGGLPFAEFIWPESPILVIVMLATTVLALGLLVALGSKLRSTTCIQLRSIAAFCGFAIIALYLLRRSGFPSPEYRSNSAKAAIVSVPDNPASSATHVIVSLYACYTLMAIFAGICAAMFVNLVLAGQRRLQQREIQGPQYPEPRPSLSGVRVKVLMAFVIPGFLPLLTAAVLAHSNGPAHATRVLVVTVLYLAVFNTAFFSIASFKDNFGKAYLVAVVFLVALLLSAVRNPTILPKAVVHTLGYGNFHSHLVLLSAQECPRLKSYGATCDAKKDDAIALENVNVLSRMGSTATLELLIERRGPAADDEVIRAKLVSSSSRHASIAPPSDQQKNSSAEQMDSILHVPLRAEDFYYRDGAIHYLHARQCDDAEMSELRFPVSDRQAYVINHEREIRMRCVKITVKKDSLLDYDKDGWPSYSDGYTKLVGVRDRLDSKKNP